MNMNFIRMIALRLMGLAVMVAVAACGDDVTNNYYQQPETSQPEDSQPEEEPSAEYEPGEWIKGVVSPCYYGLIEEPRVLYPGWLLQADGVRMYYQNSPFVQENVKSGLVMGIKNPGAGVRVTVQAAASDISRALSRDYVVKEEEGSEETLTIEFPMDWNEEALLNWHTDRMVKIQWTVSLDGQEVEKYTSTFNCRSLRCFGGSLTLTKSESPELIEGIKSYEFGDYIVKEDDAVLTIYNTPFLMGYIDENSPLIEKLKREVIDDGLFPSLPSWGGSEGDVDLVTSSSVPFTYLMMKHKIAYTIHHASNLQYVRTIDEIFANQQGYCMELALAFASFCMNQGINCTLEAVPSHMVNRIVLSDGVTLTPVDMTDLASSWKDISGYSKPLSQENSDDFMGFYNDLADDWKMKNDGYEEGRWANDVRYATLFPNDLRPWLPSFNVSQGYAQSRVAAPAKEIKVLKGLVWKKLFNEE
jgi:hypothetical protein